MRVRLALAGLLLCIPTVVEPVTVEEDPDIGWALLLENEQTAAVLDAVNLYFQDPDLNAPACFEDEAVIVIVDHAHPEYGESAPPRVGELGCVPLDDLPVSGNRPDSSYYGEE